MQTRIKKYLLNLVLFLPIFLIAQDKKLDSLVGRYYAESTDTVRAKLAYKISSYYLNSIGQIDSAYTYAYRSLRLSEKRQFIRGLAISNNFLGQACNYLRKTDSAIYYFESSKKYYEQLKDSNRVAGMLNNIGISYSNEGNIAKALDYYFLSLKIKEQLHDSEGIANALHNIGQLYNEQNDSTNSLKYFQKALEIRKKIHDESGVGYSMVAIGLHYKNQKNYALSEKYFKEAFKIAERTHEEESMAIASYNLGSLYFDSGRLMECEPYFLKSLEISRKNSDMAGVAICLDALGYLKLEQLKYPEAIELLEEAYQLAKEQMNDLIGGISKRLGEAYEKTSNYKQALFYHKISKAIGDSLFNEENVRKLTSESLKYEYEKEKLLVQKEQEKKEATLKEEAFRKNLIIGTSVFILLLVSIFSYTIYLKLKENRKQKHIIEEQQKEMIDSINYARRIQYALLAHSDLLKQFLPEHFVIFKPKDIVSGDFYWATVKANYFYLAVCDCTGHGVPGAFMSLLNINFLNEAIIEKNILEPGEIFNHVREQLIKKLDGGRDGMDAVLLRIPIGKTGAYTIDYAAANNSGLFIRDQQMIEFQKDSMPIGLGEKLGPFHTYSIEVKSGDQLYLYTDGFADQFGGPKGKKFKYKQLDEQILQYGSSSVEAQKIALETVFGSWKGKLEQVDDVCVLGICMV